LAARRAFAAGSAHQAYRRAFVLRRDTRPKGRLEVFLQAMLQFGWSTGRNARFDIRWGEGYPDIIRKQTEELVALAPDIIIVSGSSALAPLQQATRMAI
jgi:putative tryptophan/tyrosine transport system substrate-binding protein